MMRRLDDLQALERISQKLETYLEARRRVVELEQDADLAPFLETYGKVGDLPEAQPDTSLGAQELAEPTVEGETKEEMVLKLMTEIDGDADRDDLMAVAKKKAPQLVQDTDEKSLGDIMSRLARKGDLEVTSEAVRGRFGHPARYRIPQDAASETAETQSSGTDDQGPYVGMTSVDAAVAWLDEVGPPFRTTAEVTEAVLEGGFESEAKNPQTTFFSTLHRDYTNSENSKLAKDEKARWGLKKWLEKSEDSP